LYNFLYFIIVTRV